MIYKGIHYNAMYLKTLTYITFSRNSLGTGHKYLFRVEHLFCNNATDGYWNLIVVHLPSMTICYSIQIPRLRNLFHFKFLALCVYKTSLQHDHHFCSSTWMNCKIFIIRMNRVQNYRYFNNSSFRIGLEQIMTKKHAHL